MVSLGWSHYVSLSQQALDYVEYLEQILHSPALLITWCFAVLYDPGGASAGLPLSDFFFTGAMVSLGAALLALFLSVWTLGVSIGTYLWAS